MSRARSEDVIGTHLHLLGPVEAELDGRPIALGATKQRALLAMLALHANETLSVDGLVDGLWGDDPPASARKMVQLYVSQLRHLLVGGDALIVTHGRGYELRVDDDAVDVSCFERLVEQAQSRRAGADHAADRALALWRGAALADVAGEPFAAPEIRRLDELWVRAAELSVETGLAEGQDVLARLERLIAQHPLRERFHAQRMLALYRSGRQAEALDAYVTARRRLVDEAGVEPSAELRDLHERMLRQDPSLLLAGPDTVEMRAEAQPAVASGGDGSARGRGRAPPASHRWWMVIAAVSAVAVGAVLLVLSRRSDDDGSTGIAAGAVGVIDARATAVTAQQRLASAPGPAVAGAGSIWIAHPGAGTVSRIRPSDRQVTVLDVGTSPVGVAFGAGWLWVAGEDGAIAQVDPASNRVLQRISVGNGVRALGVGHGALWAATVLDGEVVRVDLRSGRVERRTAIGGQPVALAVGEDAVWVAREESGSIVRIEPRSGDVLRTITVGNGPGSIAVGLGAVWTANRQDGTVSRIDPASDRVTDTIPAGRSPMALAIADGALWIADEEGAVLRLDPRARRVTDVLPTGSSPVALAADGDNIWTSAAAPIAAHRGGTLRVGLAARAQPYDPPELDPAVGGYDFDAGLVGKLAYEGLFDYRRAAGAAGARLVPALARDVPEPVDGGRRYVIRMRPGLRYSDGSPVRAGDVRASIERAVVIERDQYGTSGAIPQIFAPVLGMAGCRTGRGACDLSRGITSDDRSGTVTFHLRRPDPELPQKLATGLVAIVPASTSPAPLRSHPPPGTGPYRVDLQVIGRRDELTRNPYFRAAGADRRPAGFADRIEVTIDDERALIAAAEHGRLDVAQLTGDPTAAQLAALRTRVGSRLRSGILAQTEYAWLDASVPPFDDPRVRRAFNLAIDRAHWVELLGGSDTASPTCQILPPGLPAYRPMCPFTLAPTPAGAWSAPDPREARRLVAASGTRGTPVVLWAEPDSPRRVRYLASVLRKLGFPTRLRAYTDAANPNVPYRDARPRPQVGLNGWIADTTDPANFIRAIVACHGIHSRFCDPRLDATVDRAQDAGLSADGAWERVERRIGAEAAVLPLANRRLGFLTSARAGNVQFHPLDSVLLDQIWVR